MNSEGFKKPTKRIFSILSQDFPMVILTKPQSSGRTGLSQIGQWTAVTTLWYPKHWNINLNIKGHHDNIIHRCTVKRKMTAVLQISGLSLDVNASPSSALTGRKERPSSWDVLLVLTHCFSSHWDTSKGL